MSSSKILVRAAALSIVASSVLAAPTVIGPHYPIGEPDMLEWIERRLAAQQDSGALAAKVDAAVADAQRKLEHPEPLPGIRRASTARTLYFDPTYTAAQDVRSPSGTLLVAAGTRVNPLTRVSLTRPLVFFDARDPDQSAFARRFIDSRARGARPVLVGGSYFDLMRSWRIPVYFDQRGALTSRFGIRHVPAIVAQDGLRLRIDEIAL